MKQVPYICFTFIISILATSSFAKSLFGSDNLKPICQAYRVKRMIEQFCQNQDMVPRQPIKVEDCVETNIEESQKLIRPVASKNYSNCRRHHLVSMIFDLTRKFGWKAVVIVGQETEFKERSMRTNLLKCTIKESFVPTRVTMNMAVEVDNILTGYFLLSDIFESKFISQATAEKNVFLVMEERKSTLEKLAKLPLTLESHVILYKRLNDGSHGVDISEVYKIRENGPMVKNNIGQWRPHRGLRITELSKWDRRSDLEGLELQAVVLHNNDIWTSVREKNRTDGTTYLELGAHQYAIWSELERSLNFSTNFSLSLDRQWGTMQKDGNFTGILGQVQRGISDVGVNSWSITDDRRQAVDFLLPLGLYSVGLMYKSANSQGDVLNWSIYQGPIDITVWAVMLATIFTCMAVALVSSSLLKIESGNEELSGFWSSFFMQGTPQEPSLVSSRILFFFLLASSLILWDSYSATLASFLSIKLEKPPFESLVTLLYKTNYKIVTVEGFFALDVFKNGNEIEREIFKSRIYTVPSWTDVVTELDANPTNVVALGGDSLQFATDGTCDYQWIPSWKHSKRYSFIIKKNSPFKSLFSYQLSKMVESGSLEQIHNRFLTIQSPTCEAFAIEPFGFAQVIFLFTFLTASFALILLLLACEFVYFHYKKANKKRREY